VTDVHVTQGPWGYRFTRDFSRGLIELAGEGIFNRTQLRAVAGILGVPDDEEVQFLDAGTFELLAEV
jgi:hypothetical protein